MLFILEEAKAGMENHDIDIINLRIIHHLRINVDRENV